MSAADEIAKYFDLFKAGAITEAEFTAAKASLIGTPQPAQTATKNNVNGAAPAAGNNANGANKNPKNNPKAGQKFPANANPLQTGVAVAAGVVGGRLISDKLLDDPSTDPATPILQRLLRRRSLFLMVTLSLEPLLKCLMAMSFIRLPKVQNPVFKHSLAH